MMIRPLFKEVQDTYVGVKPIQNEDWGLFPNPSNGEITLTIPENQGELELFVYDVAGRVVYDTKELTSPGTIQLPEKLTAGVYFIELRNKKEKLGKIKQLILN
jgi:hypothetical protein